MSLVQVEMNATRWCNSIPPPSPVHAFRAHSSSINITNREIVDTMGEQLVPLIIF